MKITLLIVAFLIIIISLLQTSKSSGIEAFTGKNDNVFSKKKQKGPEKTIWWATFGLGVAFYLITFIWHVVK